MGMNPELNSAHNKKSGGAMEELIVLPTNSSGVVFLAGWSDDVEGVAPDFYRWTTSVTASIKVPIVNRVNAPKAYRLVLSALPYTHPNGPSYQDVSVYLDGAFLTQIRLSAANIIETEIYLPALNSSSLAAFSLLTLVMPNGAVPSEHGNGNDLRTLGIGLRKLELNRVS
jgi:hypothetical protein